MKRYSLWLLFLVGIGAHSAISAPLIYGQGNSTCGYWLKLRGTHEIWALEAAGPVQGWLRGYLTAMGLFDFAVRKQDMAATDSDAIDAWTDNYCHAHPLDNMLQAGNALHDELLKRAGYKP